MNYIELKKEFNENQEIPYEELLKTIEWEERRKKITERDNFCCTKCGKTNSFRHSNLNISIQTKDKLTKQSVTLQNKSIDTVKKELKINEISIIKTSFKNSCIGITENGILFLADIDTIKNVPKDELVINNGITEFGLQFHVFGKRGQQFLDNNFVIPILVENPISMHVHHKFYVQNKLPWEYDDNALITLCNNCHFELHEHSIIHYYSFVDGELRNLNYTPCSRCNGAGVFPEYRRIQNGVCFRCNGKKYEELINP